MKKLFFLTGILLGFVAVRRLVPAERRAQLRESLAQMPATMMERCMESMPEDSPPKVMMSAMRRFEEQNDELLALCGNRTSSCGNRPTFWRQRPLGNPRADVRLYEVRWQD